MTRLPDDFTGLTDRGWPRPFLLHDDVVRPVAWATPAPNFAEMEPSRSKKAPTFCQVCGEPHDPDDDVVIFLEGGLRDLGGEVVGLRSNNIETDYGFNREQLILRAVDEAIMHERCAALTARHCPRIREKHRVGELFAFAGPAKSIARHRPELGGDSVTFLYMPGADARLWRVPGRPPRWKR